MPAAAFARAVGVPPRTVRHWCAAGTVRARRRGPKIWEVDLDTLKAGDTWELALYRAAIGARDPAANQAPPEAEPD